jgi:hypothetical protein
MKLFLILSALLFAFPALAAHDTGAGASTALGVTLGSPNGITGRTWITPESSIDYGGGWSIQDGHQFEAYADYLWNRPDTFELNEQKFDLFFGGGLALRSHSGNGDELVLGPRLPVGVSYEFAQPALELFALFAVNVGIVPSSDVFFDLHVGARFYLF